MLELVPYAEQRARWPASGRHVMAAYDETSIVVYQAYKPSIARHAVKHARLGGAEFSRERMSWIKPGFLWMMFRSGWASKVNQERVLAVRIARAGFDALLAAAVHSSYVEAVYGAHAEWKQALSGSDVRLQWDPDHDPHGNKLERRAIQLGLRGETLARYVDEWTLGIDDITERVHAERARVGSEALCTPRERVYPVSDVAVAARLGVAPSER